MDEFDFSFAEKCVNAKTDDAEMLKYLIRTFGNNVLVKESFELYKHLPWEMMYENVSAYIYANTSQYVFPGDLVKVYPRTRELKARISTMCHITGSIIYPGTHYVIHSPLVYNISQNRLYFLQKAIKAGLYYQSFLSSGIAEFDKVDYFLQRSYDLMDDPEIDYYGFACNYGDGLTLKPYKK